MRLRVRKVRRYRHARYPRGQYRARVKKRPAPTATKGVSALLLMALTEACDGGPFGTGSTGPPPVMPTMVTENEARQVIQKVFTDNGIQLQTDVSLVFRWAADSIAFDVDGFNDSLQVGFEYVNQEENGLFFGGAKAALDSAAVGQGPHIKVMGPTPDLEGVEPTVEAAMEAEVQAFIDLLRAQGII